VGISRGAVKLIAMQLVDDERDRGKAITYGVQAVQATLDDVTALLQETKYGTTACRIKTAALDEKVPQKNIHQKELFTIFGYSSVESIDYYPDENPTYVLDLNQAVPPDLHSQYDLVYDGGTMEHCFNSAVFLQNTVKLLRPGGIVIHHVPMNNWVNHGFYQFSPTLFFDYYSTNGFTDLQMIIHTMARGKERFLLYDPCKHDYMPYSLGGKDRILIFFRARKTENANTHDLQNPIQGRYRQTFGKEESTSSITNKTGFDRFVTRFKKSLKKRLFKYQFKSL
jgi:SAM-dependent methyltransferase